MMRRDGRGFSGRIPKPVAVHQSGVPGRRGETRHLVLTYEPLNHAKAENEGERVTALFSCCAFQLRATCLNFACMTSSRFENFRIVRRIFSACRLFILNNSKHSLLGDGFQT